MRKIIFILSLLPSLALFANDYRLPDLVNPERRVFVGNQAQNIGLAVEGKLRARGQLLEQEAIQPYIESLGQKLAAYAPFESGYHFFVIHSPSINAFAAPGGYVGINSALIMLTDNEDQLAGVLAHEIGHVSNNHIARSMVNAQNYAWIQSVAMVAGVLSASVGNTKGAAAVTTGGQAYIKERQLEYSRAQEQQADDAGLRILQQAGYDDRQMAAFLHKLTESGAPEFLQNHPLPLNRVARQLQNAKGNKDPRSPLDYQLAKVAITHFNSSSENSYQPTLPLAYFYGQYLQAQKENDTLKMKNLLEKLPADKHPLFAILQGQFLLSKGDFLGAKNVYQSAWKYFKKDSRLILPYSRTLLLTGDLKIAERILNQRIKSHPSEVQYYDLLGEILQRQGRFAEQFILTASYYALIGNYDLAEDQLQRALQDQTFPSHDRQRITQLKNHYHQLSTQRKNH